MRNIGLDLGTSWYSIGRPEEVKLYESIEKINDTNDLIKMSKNFSVWDSIAINGPLVAKEFLEIFKKEYNLDFEYINSNNECILVLVEDENNDDINKNIEEVYLELFHNIKSKKSLKLSIVSTKNDVNINFPRIKYILK